MVSCVAAFNKVFLALLKDLRRNADLKKILSKNYPAFDHSSDTYIETFGTIAKSLFDNLTDNYATVSSLQDIELAKGVTLQKCFDVSEGESSVMNKYILTLLLIWLVNERSNEEGPELLVALNKLKDIDSGAETDVSDVFDEDIAKILKMIAAQSGEPMLGDLGGGGTDPTELLKMLSDTKIGSMAKEVAEDLARSNSVGEEKDFMKVIGEVTQKIGNKLQSGDITQQDLMKEAMQFMSKVKPPADMLKNLSGMMAKMNASGSPTQRQSSARDRLRSKLALR